MYVTRERRGDRLIFWLVESKRQDGKVRTHKLAYLGTLYETYAPWLRWQAKRDRARFWKQARVAVYLHAGSSDWTRFAAQLGRWVGPTGD